MSSTGLRHVRHRPPPIGRRARGVTLLELLVTVSIAAIVMAIALPSFQSVQRTNRLAASTNQFLAALSLARTEAIRNTRGAGVCASSTGSACVAGADWTAGWMVWSDVDGDGAFDSGEERRYMQGNPSVRVTGPAAAGAIRFDARGRIVGGAQDLVLQPLDCGGQPLRRTLTVGATGQVRKVPELATCV